ncbi:MULTISPECIES: hypothetical protein [unclassified Bradyrhizobium]|uniref:hypothetical protein n=1 Tax=unclassified Bradyrhizobium TaxID=2631580 RepID=UPI00247A9541|nr:MULTISPECIES: hypothetical protein [unclassified Bradyrhizobium]WGR74310.1 hypothetical protein MTX24_16430 [Bradyrhizobium sp. ISRA426]WGR79145.1 hypothetical protein MTX21_01545 [Bradyrhizobium sp. ISRA430]WGR90633.1 hypothetical protein MTX25_39690 [Bradyrhizobium sp. ISRA432]
MSRVNAKGTGKKALVRAAALSGYCNTSLDLADETGLSVRECSGYVAALIRQRELRRTTRRLPNSSANGRGRKLHVFEVNA